MKTSFRISLQTAELEITSRRVQATGGHLDQMDSLKERQQEAIWKGRHMVLFYFEADYTFSSFMHHKLLVTDPKEENKSV